MMIQQQDVRFLQQQGRHGQSGPLPAGQRADRFVEIVVGERQTAEDPPGAFVVTVPVAVFERRLLFVRGCFGDLLGHGAAVGEVVSLLQITQTCASLEIQLAAVLLQFACQDAHQRALTRAVGADDADAVPGVHVERDVLQHRFDPETLIQFGCCDNAHNQIILP